MFVAVLLIAGAMFVVLSTGDQTGTSIKVGVISPMSGAATTMGEEIVNSINLASTNSLSIVFEDDQCDTKKSISAYQKLKLQGTHVFYVACSGSVLALAPIAKQDGNLIVTAYAGSSEIRKTGDEVIRFIPDAVSVAEAMAEFASTLPISSKIGLLYEERIMQSRRPLLCKTG